MGYSAVKGGLEAIAAAERLVQHPLLAPGETPLDTRQLENQLGLAVDQVMGEGGLYAPDLAALALSQAEGDLVEAAFLLRAYRSTLPRLGYSLPVRGDEMRVVRRISSAFKDVPGGQLLGRTRDYTQRLLDFSLLGAGTSTHGPDARPTASRPLASTPRRRGRDDAASPRRLGSGSGRGDPRLPEGRRHHARGGPDRAAPGPDPAVEPPDITLDAVATRPRGRPGSRPGPRRDRRHGLASPTASCAATAAATTARSPSCASATCRCG